MEEEIQHHQKLLEEIRKEATYIKENSVEGLLQSVRAIGERTKRIVTIQRNMQQRIKEILVSSGMDPDSDSLKSFLSLIPPADGRKMRIYQNSLERLKKWILEINHRNRSFIQDSLSYWKDLFSVATGLRQQSLTYVQNGQKKIPFCQPLSLDRKV